MNEDPLMPIAAEIQPKTALLPRSSFRLPRSACEATAWRSRPCSGVLRVLEFESLTASESSRRLGLDPPTLVRAVDGPERRDLARRGRVPKDRRRVPIALADKGRALIQAVPALSAQDLPFRALQALGLESGTRLCELLRALVVQSPEGRSAVELLVGREKR